MNQEELNHFRNALRQNRDALLEWLDSDVPDRDMRLAGSKKSDVETLLSDLREALNQVESGEFGRCCQCDGEVETERLQADYTCLTCLSHYSDSQVKRLETELELISKVQRDLLPCKVPSLPGIQIAAHMESAGVVGGDYYDFFTCPRGTQGLVIADVMDKGLPAGMIVSNLQASLRILGTQAETPQELLTRLNGLFKHNLNLIRFFSIFVGSIDVKAKTLTFCNGGHHPPLWYQASAKAIDWLCPTGPAVGLTGNPEYHSETVPLGPGDLFVFYTDGLVETNSRNGKTFDEKKLAAHIRKNAGQSAESVMSGLLETAKGHGRFRDDVTLIVMKVDA